MFTNTRKGLKAWVRYDGNNNAVASSLIFLKDKPKVGKWKEYMDVNLCCPTDCTPNYGQWKLVTGGQAGDGVVLVDDDLQYQQFTFVGPNDGESNGWVYLTRYFATETCLNINYEWASFDGDTEYDRPVYWLSETKPTGEPGDTDPKVDNTPEDGEWNITVPAGQWFSVGIYSTDSCCGRGFLSIEVNEFEGPCGG